MRAYARPGFSPDFRTKYAAERECGAGNPACSRLSGRLDPPDVLRRPFQGESAPSLWPTPQQSPSARNCSSLSYRGQMYCKLAGVTLFCNDRPILEIQCRRNRRTHRNALRDRVPQHSAIAVFVPVSSAICQNGRCRQMRLVHHTLQLTHLL
jgi:hypothetical protein